MTFPQVLLVVLYLWSLGKSWWFNGETRTISFKSSLFSFCVVMALLIWGGFFG